MLSSRASADDTEQQLSSSESLPSANSRTPPSSAELTGPSTSFVPSPSSARSCARAPDGVDWVSRVSRRNRHFELSIARSSFKSSTLSASARPTGTPRLPSEPVSETSAPTVTVTRSTAAGAVTVIVKSRYSPPSPTADGIAYSVPRYCVPAAVPEGTATLISTSSVPPAAICALAGEKVTMFCMRSETANSTLVACADVTRSTNVRDSPDGTSMAVSNE